MKIRPVGAEFHADRRNFGQRNGRTDGWTDGQTDRDMKLIVAFRNDAKGSRIAYFPNTTAVHTKNEKISTVDSSWPHVIAILFLPMVLCVKQ
jgi:hypothetical protein